MDAVEEVKSRLSIEDVVSEYVQLKRAGSNFKGLSPFSNEKTPSFMVSPEKQIWHDFSSGKGGDAFSFVMEMEGLDFKGALELLARKAGIDLTQYQTGRTGETGKLKERLYEASELAAHFYQVQFSKNKAALEYVFKQRQFSKEIVLSFRLGYSPNNGTALCDYLKKKNFTDKELQQAGLSARRYSGIGDMFRGRLQVPLMDPQGRVVGFTARLLDDEPNAPKYLNTPQTLLYDKGRHVFGLHLAKDAIREHKYVVLVEGNLDVIASHQTEVRQVVATAGTALTEMHLKALSRFTSDIRLAFDADRAGLAATERAIPLASKVGVSLSIITLPEGKDPDELVRKDPAAWRQAIQNSQYALDWLIERYTQLLDLTSAHGKRQFSDIMLQVVRRLTDEVERDHYLRQIAGLLGVSTEALQSKLKSVKGPDVRLKKGKAEPVVSNKSQLELTKIQDHLLVLTLLHPRLRNYLSSIMPEMLPDERAQKLLSVLKEKADLIIPSDSDNLRPDSPPGEGSREHAADDSGQGVLRGLGEYVKILRLQYETLYYDLEDLELEYEAARLQIRLIETYVKSKKAELIMRMREADEAATQDLLAQAKKLDELLKQINLPRIS